MTNTLPMLKRNPISAYQLYVGAVTFFGVCLAIWGLWQLPENGEWLDVALLLALSIIAVVITASIEVGPSSITYAVDSVISFAAIPIFGPGVALVTKAVAGFGLWALKPGNENTWKRSWSQLGFNTGNHLISLGVGAWVLLLFRGWLASRFGDDALLTQFLPWIPAAIVMEQVNLWLLIGVLRLQNGRSINPLAIWQEEQWATQILVLVLIVGGAILSFAMFNYGRVGIIVFFLPILLSAYAFRLYVGQMKTHLDNLEQAVSDRTSELTAKTAQLTARTDELTEVNRQKDSFLAVLTHDMMTPLSNIRYCADLISTNEQTLGENKELSDLMLRSQNTLVHMVRNIVDIEKVVAGISFDVHKVPTNMTYLIGDVVETMRPQADEDEITLHFDAEAELPHCVVDPYEMERIVTNLLSNALKYTEPGGQVTLKLNATGDTFCLTVQDTGYGIAADELITIFDHFHRAPQHQDKAIGTGLGLAIVRALVEEHSGTIAVDSKVGVGTTFTIKIPIAHTEDDSLL